MQMTNEFSAVYLECEEGGYMAFIPELPGANTQGDTLDEAREMLREATALVLEANREQAFAHIDRTRTISELITITYEIP